MPIYEYQCRECEHTFEIKRGFLDGGAQPFCPRCDSADTRRIFSVQIRRPRRRQESEDGAGSGESVREFAERASAQVRMAPGTSGISIENMVFIGGDAGIIAGPNAEIDVRNSIFINPQVGIINEDARVNLKDVGFAQRRNSQSQ